jgi:micrococcal nuclease
MGDVTPFRRGQRQRLPASWQPYLRRRGLSFAQVRMMIWAGLLAGLLLWQALRLWSGLPLLPDVAPAPAQSGHSESFTGPVRVIDGDTFDYGGMRVRIADIDTPEVRGQCPEETRLAARATRRMRALLAAGPFELHPLSSGRDEDRYGRKLRIVTRGGRSLGDVLVAEGLARTWSGRREPWC